MNENKPEYIKNRESWFKIILISVFSLVVCAALLTAPYKIDFTKIGFSDFLSLSLAIFSISLSAAFYFKATDTSNRFYDNTYNFMKDISENLGRIEERFGEQLKHLDEGYTGISEAILKGYQSGHEEIEKERQQVEQKINELVDKTPASDYEKDDLKNELKRMNDEITSLNALLNDKQRHLSFLAVEAPKIDQILTKIVSVLPIEAFVANSYMEIEKHFRNALLKVCSSREIKALVESGILTHQYQFTEIGTKVINEKVKEYRKLKMFPDSHGQYPAQENNKGTG